MLELGRVLAAPYCGMLLADLGADVVKIESPEGDDLRGWAPPASPDGGSTYFEATKRNKRNKRSVCIDLKGPGAEAVLHRLVAASDVLTGTFAAAGILAALRNADRTRRGGRVETSLLECALAAMPNLTAGWLQAGVAPQRLGNFHGNASPYGVFRARDGWVVVAVGNDAQWARMVECLGHPELGSDPRYAVNAARVERRSEVSALVEQLFGLRARDEIVTALAAAGVAAGPISTVPEVLDSPQVAAAGASKLDCRIGSAEGPSGGRPLPSASETPSRRAPARRAHRRGALRAGGVFDRRAREAPHRRVLP